MRDDRRYILRWLSGMLMLLLLTACSKSSDSDGPEPDKPVLKIYVFPPNKPIVTRGDEGDVNATDAENKIHNLRVWVFEHHKDAQGNSLQDDGKFVGHINLNNVDISSSGSTVTMELNDNFGTSEVLPHVDVYVAANVTTANCGISLSATTTRDQLEAALIDQNYFGVSNLIKSVPADGLPMSGVLKNQKITGSSPVYQVSTESGSLANARLVRAVSKLRFIFSKSLSNPDVVTVNGISLDADVLPTQEYLFLENDYDLSTTQKWRVVTSSYESESSLVSTVAGTEIRSNESPTSYSYQEGMTGQAYEDLINQGVKDGKLSDLGTFYLRESDRALMGKISYSIKKPGSETPTNSTPAFAMKSPTDPADLTQSRDFSRNHTWIVYAYFISSGDLIMGMVEIKNWSDSEANPQGIYNW